jgi:CCR4-NOT transcription complex subunit 4
MPFNFLPLFSVENFEFLLIFMQLLQQREYFGQYGKVLKVSMSRTAAGVVQQFPNNTCSV